MRRPGRRRRRRRRRRCGGPPPRVVGLVEAAAQHDRGREPAAEPPAHLVLPVLALAGHLTGEVHDVDAVPRPVDRRRLVRAVDEHVVVDGQPGHVALLIDARAAAGRPGRCRAVRANRTVSMASGPTSVTSWWSARAAAMPPANCSPPAERRPVLVVDGDLHFVTIHATISASPTTRRRSSARRSATMAGRCFTKLRIDRTFCGATFGSGPLPADDGPHELGHHGTGGRPRFDQGGAHRHPRRCVLGQHQQPVALHEVAEQVRALAARRRVLVAHDRRRHVPVAPAQQPPAPGQVGVLVVEEEALVEEADLLQVRRAAAARCRRTRRRPRRARRTGPRRARGSRGRRRSHRRRGSSPTLLTTSCGAGGRSQLDPARLGVDGDVARLAPGRQRDGARRVGRQPHRHRASAARRSAERHPHLGARRGPPGARLTGRRRLGAPEALVELGVAPRPPGRRPRARSDARPGDARRRCRCAHPSTGRRRGSWTTPRRGPGRRRGRRPAAATSPARATASLLTSAT